MSNNAPTNLQTLLHAPHSHSPSGTFSLVTPTQRKFKRAFILSKEIIEVK